MRALCLVWTTPDREVARKMVFMYGANSLIKGWWDSVRLLVWGPTARLLAEDPELRPDIEDLRAAGVELMACKSCADSYEASSALEDLGFRVIYTGEELTRMLQGDWTVLTV